MMMYWGVFVQVILVLGILMYAWKNWNMLKREQKPLDILDEQIAKDKIHEKEYEEQKRMNNSKNKYYEILFQHNPKG
ncbi:SHOCT domain-containing protein [Arenibacter palladensis]|uniref:SHOCT domain-containing protein n=1 Tax=Arenibacter palladensis TaxID=237373 RepID=UPI002FCEA4F9